MLVTMTPHFYQQTQNYITKKLRKNVAIIVLILGWQKWQNAAFLTKSVFLTNECEILEEKSFGAYLFIN